MQVNADAFKAAHNKSRNGVNEWLFNRLYPRLKYSDGVRECAATGCYWLLDLLGTEVVPAVDRHRRALDGLGFVVVRVSGYKATIFLKRDTSDPDKAALWRRPVEFTDMPEGEWVFYLADEGSPMRLFLPSEY